MGPKDAFSLIRIPSEKKRLFRELIETNSELLLKGNNDQIYRVNAEKITDDKWICCRPQNDLTDADNINFHGEHIVNFSIGTERYFLMSTLHVHAPWILMQTEVDVYHLQRRKSLRVAIPEEMPSLCNVMSMNDQKCFHNTKVLDFSVGGLRLSYAQRVPVFKASDSLLVSVHLGSRKPFEVVAIVRHNMGFQPNSDEQIIGIEFGQKDIYLENKLLALQMDLQGEIFRKWKRHQY